MWRVLVLLLLVEFAGSATGPQPPKNKPQPSAATHKPVAGSRVLKPGAGFSNVIIITLDTTRADRMDFLGSQKGLTPNLDALAKDPQRLAAFGVAGRRYVEQFEKTRVFENFLGELAGVL